MTHSNQGDIIVLSCLLVTALILTIIAWAIKFKKQVSFIAGYDEKTCKNKDGLANYVGGTLFTTGLICLASAITAFILPVHTKLLVGIYFITLAAGTVVAAIGASKFLKDVK